MLDNSIRFKLKYQKKNLWWASRQKSSHIRRKRRKIQLLKNLKSKEEEIGDLQIQLLDLKKFVSNEGERILSEISKGTCENNNLVKWLKLYDEQIESYRKEIYNLNLKLYFSSPPPPPPPPLSSSSSSSSSSQSQQPPQQQPQQQPQFESLADYFDYMKNQE